VRLSITILTPEYSCNIQKINEYIIILEEGIHARGESSQDTMMNVNPAYMACKDADFVRHAKDEYGRWEQGATITLKEYMASCLVKYKTLKMKGLWEAPRSRARADPRPNCSGVITEDEGCCKVWKQDQGSNIQRVIQEN
jgi:hypothetical protein